MSPRYKENTERINVFFSKPVLDMLKERASVSGMSVSGLVRYAVLDKLGLTEKNIPAEKKRIIRRVTEILKDYLYDEEETFARIDMYFEANNGEETQEKTVTFGSPSEKTPDEYRDEPYGYDDLPDNGSLKTRNFDTLIYPEKTVKWKYSDGRSWDGKTLSQVIAEKNEKNM